jgi:hypothetical protein
VVSTQSTTRYRLSVFFFFFFFFNVNASELAICYISVYLSINPERRISPVKWTWMNPLHPIMLKLNQIDPCMWYIDEYAALARP